MTVISTDTFDDAISKITDRTVVERALKSIQKLESANSLRDVTNIKTMKGYSGFYRLRFGDYRIGFSLEDVNTVMLLSVDHRNEFYRFFPQSFA
jgi:mRNA-degrading endonuclease RelE of RelBE toxin-antitoxin system